MKIYLLARNPNLYSHRRLVEEAETRGHDIQIINTLRCYMNITSHRPEVRYRGERLEVADAVIPRIGQSMNGIVKPPAQERRAGQSWLHDSISIS